MKTTKKLLVLLLSLAIMVTFMPVTAMTAWADDSSLIPGDGKYMVEVLTEPEGGTIATSEDAEAGPNPYNGFTQYLYSNGAKVTINITPSNNPEFKLDSIKVMTNGSGGFEENYYFSEPNTEEGQKGFDALEQYSYNDEVHSFVVSDQEGTYEDIAIEPYFINEDNEVRKAVEEGRYAYAANNANEFRDKLATEIYNKNSAYFEDENAVMENLKISFENDDQGIAEKGQYSYELTITDNFKAEGIADVLNSDFDIVLLCNRENDEPLTQIVEGNDGETSRRVIFNFGWKGDIEVYGNGAAIVEQNENNFDQHTIFIIAGLDEEKAFSLFVHQPCKVDEDEWMRDLVNNGKYAYYPGTGTAEGNIENIKNQLADEIYNTYFYRDASDSDDNLVSARGYFLSADDVKDSLEVTLNEDNNYDYSLEIVPEVVEDEDIEGRAAVVSTGEVGVIAENRFYVCSGETEELVTWDGSSADADVEFEFERDEDDAILPITVYGNGARIIKTLENSWDRVVYSIKLGNKTFLLNVCNTLGIEQPEDGQTEFSYVVYGDKVETSTPGVSEPIGSVEISFVGKADDPANWSDKETDIDSSNKITTRHRVFVPDSVKEVTFTMEPPENCDAWVSIGDAAALKNTDKTFTITDGDFEKSIIIDFREGEPNKESSIVKHTFEGWQGVQVSINGQKVDNSNEKNSTKKSYTASVTHPETCQGLDAEKVRIEFAFEEELSHIKIDNKNGGQIAYDENVGWTGNAAKLATYYDFHYHYSVDIPKSNTGVYEITTTVVKTEDSEDNLVSYFGWNTEGQDPLQTAEDAISGGKVSLKKAIYKGPEISVLLDDPDNPGTKKLTKINGTIDDGYTVYDPSQSINKLEDGSAFWWENKVDGTGDFGYDVVEPDAPGTYGTAFFPEGTELTIELTPDYGKQLVEFAPIGLNFENVANPETGEAVSTYTFSVPKGQFHLGAKFRNISDEVSLDENNTTVTGAGISVTEGDAPVQSGTLNMNVEQVAVDPANEDAVAAVDITMDNVFYAGSREVYEDWTQHLSELEDPVTITLDVDGINRGDTVQVMREHEDLTESIAAVVNDNGEVEFRSDKFSTYTIVKTAGSGGGGGGDSDNPEDEDFVKAKTDAVAACDALAEANKDAKYPYIANMIAEAKNAIAKVDSSKMTVDEYKAALDKIITELKADIEAQKALDEASAVKEAKVNEVKVTQKALKALKGHKIKVTFKRTKVDGEKITSYQIYRKLGKKGTYKRIKTVSSKKSTITFTNKKLKKGKTYYYKVRGVVTLENTSKAYTKFSAAKKIKCK